MEINFDAALKKQGWNIRPIERFRIPSSYNPLVNAASAIAVSAYPSLHHHKSGGKAEKYSLSLLAYIFRISKLLGDIDHLPPWAASLKSESMQRHLDSGQRNLARAFMLKDLTTLHLL